MNDKQFNTLLALLGKEQGVEVTRVSDLKYSWTVTLRLENGYQFSIPKQAEFTNLMGIKDYIIISFIIDKTNEN